MTHAIFVSRASSTRPADTYSGGYTSVSRRHISPDPTGLSLTGSFVSTQ
jgi:hypothetical protein